MNESSKEQASSDEENDESDKEDTCDDDDTITEAFISMKVKKVRP
jgi:hypothetical protein